MAGEGQEGRKTGWREKEGDEAGWERQYLKN